MSVGRFIFLGVVGTKFKNHLSECNNYKKSSPKFTLNYKIFYTKLRCSRNLILNNELWRK